MPPEFERKINQESQKIKENKEEPKISYEILYSAHHTAKDFEKLAEVFPRCDVYVPECSNWNPEALTDFQSLSRGEITPLKLREKYGLPENSTWAIQFETIYQSQKPILFADLSEGHGLKKISSQADILRTQSLEKFENGGFPMALRLMRESVAKRAEYRQKREEIMKANLETKIKELIENNPRFENKKEIKVLLTLGSAHTRFFHSLKKEKPSTLRKFANLPSVFLSQSEASRRMMFSKDVTDELLAKTFIEYFLAKYIGDITDDTDKISRMVRKLSSKISLGEIKKLSENWTKDDRIIGLDSLPPSLIKFFQNKGIKIPKNEEEMDEMLKK